MFPFALMYLVCRTDYVMSALLKNAENTPVVSVRSLKKVPVQSLCLMENVNFLHLQQAAHITIYYTRWGNFTLFGFQTGESINSHNTTFNLLIPPLVKVHRVMLPIKSKFKYIMHKCTIKLSLINIYGRSKRAYYHKSNMIAALFKIFVS